MDLKNTPSAIANAVTIASAADVTIVVMGLDQTQESEGHDRSSLALPGQQHSLIEQVGRNAKGRVILVVLSGGPVDVVLIGGYPGMYGGLALADVVFGEFNPTD